MDALGLLCESHRRTEVLTSQEMELLHHFLPSSLNSQSPGVRQLTVSLLKKVTLLFNPVLCYTLMGIAETQIEITHAPGLKHFQ